MTIYCNPIEIAKNRVDQLTTREVGRGVRYHGGDLLFSVTFYRYRAALATLAAFGNGGIVGPLGRVMTMPL